MHPALRTPCATRNLLTQTGKIIIQFTRIYVDRTEDIQLPPEPTTCCMSGCANCVWIEYAETLSKLLNGNTEKAREMILQQISDPNLKVFLSTELKNLENRKDN